MPGQEPKYWLHRISWERQVSYPLYKAGYLPIGWGDFGTDELLSKLQNNFDGTIDDEWGQLNRNRFSLQNFISKMKKGDYVVVPRNGTFDIVRIKGDKVLTAETLCREKSDLLKSLNIEKEDTLNKLKVDLGFFWEIELVCDNISSKKYDNIARKLQYRGTNLDISDIRGAISQLIKKTDISMQNMKLVRTFHPVGHGAFYTERFYNNGVCVFTAVYDCGGDPEGGLKTYIDNNFKDGKIDVLFISHLHEDHISGVEYIIDRCEKVFLPSLTPNQQIDVFIHNCITTKQDDKKSKQFIERVYGGDYEGKIVFVDSIESVGNDFEPKKEVVNIEDIQYGKIGAGVSLTSKYVPFWVYYPYNPKYDLRAEFLKEFEETIENDKVNFEKVKEICKKEETWKKIKDFYKDKKDENSLYNEYSMTVYSGLCDSARRKPHIVHIDCNCEFDFPYCECYYRCCHRIIHSGCLYTGDFVASVDNVDELIEYYNSYLEYAEVVQVPHHGSEEVGKKKHYGFKLFDKAKIGIFSVKFGKYNNVPAPYVIQALKTNRVCPRIITQKDYTRLELHYHLI